MASSHGGPARAAAIRTFLIADVRGYTRFTAQHGDEAASRLATKFAEVAGEAVEAWGGELVELRGDEALAVFDSARQALRAAVELQSAFADETERVGVVDAAFVRRVFSKSTGMASRQGCPPVQSDSPSSSACSRPSSVCPQWHRLPEPCRAARGAPRLPALAQPKRSSQQSLAHHAKVLHSLADVAA